MTWPESWLTNDILTQLRFPLNKRVSLAALDLVDLKSWQYYWLGDKEWQWTASQSSQCFIRTSPCICLDWFGLSQKDSQENSLLYASGRMICMILSQVNCLYFIVISCMLGISYLNMTKFHLQMVVGLTEKIFQTGSKTQLNCFGFCKAHPDLSTKDKRYILGWGSKK